MVQGYDSGNIRKGLRGLLRPFFVGVGAAAAQPETRVDREHHLAVFPDLGGVLPGAVGTLHMAVTEFVAQRPALHAVRFRMAVFGTEAAVRRGCITVAVFHPVGIVLRSRPGGIDGDEGLCADLVAQCEEIVCIDLVIIVSPGVGLCFHPQVGLEGRPPIPGHKAVLPIVFAGEVSAGPPKQPDPHLLHERDHIPAHPMEMICRHQGNGAKRQGTGFTESDLQPGVGIASAGGEGGAVGCIFIAAEGKLLSVEHIPIAPDQRNGYSHGREYLGSKDELVISPFGHGQSALADACDPGGKPGDPLGVTLMGTDHPIAFVMPGIGLQIRVGEGSLFADPVPAEGAAEPVRQTDEFPVLQHLGADAAVDAVSGVLQIVAEIKGGEGLRALHIQGDVDSLMQGTVCHDILPLISYLLRIPGYLPADSSELCRSHPVW